MIKFDGVTFAYPQSDKYVLDHLDLTVEDGEFLCIIGHSGCGKSTLLRLTAGLDFPSGGKGCNRAICRQNYCVSAVFSVSVANCEGKCSICRDEDQKIQQRTGQGESIVFFG